MHYLCSRPIDNTAGGKCAPLKTVDNDKETLIDHRYLCSYIDPELGNANCSYSNENSDYDSSLSEASNFDSNSDSSASSDSDSGSFESESSAVLSRRRRMTGRPVKDARNAFLPSLVEIMHTPYCNLDKKETCDKIADADLKNKGTASLKISCIYSL